MKLTKPNNISGLVLAIFGALTFRWGIAEAYQIPSGSMEPTLQIHDRILVNKLVYGLRIPFTKFWLAHFQEPKRSDVIVFKYPRDESIFYVKRIVALPGEKVEVNAAGEVFINDLRAIESGFESKHRGQNHLSFGPQVVPENHVFVMGDNRDNSSDSRVWGFVPKENILGRADLIWFGFIR